MTGQPQRFFIPDDDGTKREVTGLYPLLEHLGVRERPAPVAPAATVDPNPPAVQRLARAARLTWLLLLGAAGALEVFGVLHPGRDDTLSETTRWLWRTDTTLGRWAFRLSWVAFAAWFGPHIVKLEVQAARRRTAVRP